MTPTEHTPASPRSALAPDTRLLDPRAARAWTEKMAVTALGGGIYEIESDSGHTYAVDLLEGRCSCPDHQMRGVRCKHIRRVALEITGGRAPAPGRRAIECVACGHDAFVREDDPAVCDDCRLTPGTTVRDRETDALLVVVETTDQRAAEVTVPKKRERTLADLESDAAASDDAEETTVADYPNNRYYPREDPIVRAVYPFSGDPNTPFEELRRYSFPLSRLDRVLPRPDDEDAADEHETELDSLPTP
ncbi:SWIM zinc finger family protein [Halomarina oriensis]|uniref:SWIM zinc finger family protein n=2 Tax=Halomarina oriensis TaxID=671145 RepID=A0A6B0GPX2_9EURY|nr:SWIM zinc finger family protein [Halomarina oriensis]